LLLLLRRSHLKTFLTTLFLIILMAPAVHGLIYLNICPDYPAAAVPHTLAGKAAFYPVIIASKFFCFTDTLAFGCLGAVLLAWCPAQVASTLTRRPWLPALAGLACILVPYIPERLAGTETVDRPAILVEFGNTLQAAGFTILLLQSILLPAAGLYRVLNWKPVVQIGVLSYSIYIWQQMFVPCPWPRLYAVWWAGPWLLLLLLAAATSYWAMELPLLKLRNAFRPKPAPPAA
jgi:peptidoglycan/LPS O-acetylase OafA/YrhL